MFDSFKSHGVPGHFLLHRVKPVTLKKNSETLCPNSFKSGTELQQTSCYIRAKYGADQSSSSTGFLFFVCLWHPYFWVGLQNAELQNTTYKWCTERIFQVLHTLQFATSHRTEDQFALSKEMWQQRKKQHLRCTTNRINLTLYKKGGLPTCNSSSLSDCSVNSHFLPICTYSQKTMKNNRLSEIGTRIWCFPQFSS